MTSTSPESHACPTVYLVLITAFWAVGREAAARPSLRGVLLPLEGAWGTGQHPQRMAVHFPACRLPAPSSPGVT